MPVTSREKYNAYMRDYMRERIARRRAEAVMQLGGKCVRCGTTENLEFDHIEPGSADPKTRGGRGVMWTFSEERLQAELAKCQLLCHKHHREKTKECGETGGGRNKIPDDDYIHGTVRMYAYKGCRCPLCMRAKDFYRKKLIRIDEAVTCENTALDEMPEGALAQWKELAAFNRCMSSVRSRDAPLCRHIPSGF